jgi:hypothetical protein
MPESPTPSALGSQGPRRLSRPRSVVVMVAAFALVFAVFSLVSTRSATPPSPAGTASLASWTAGETSRSTAYARQLLARAALPSGAVALNHEVAGLPYQSPFEGSGIGDFDASRYFLVDRSPDVVLRQLLAEQPAGAKVQSASETEDGRPVMDFVQDTFATTGPHLIAATLVYTIVHDGAKRAALRVDAQATWVPTRPTGDLVPLTDTVSVTSDFADNARNVSSPLAISASPQEAVAIIAALNALPAGTGSVCHNQGVMFHLSIGPSGAGFPLWAADAWCGSEVDLSIDGSYLLPLGDANCALLRAVDAVLPSGTSINGTGDIRISCAP